MIEVLLFGLSENRGGIETYLEKIWNHIDHSQFHFSFIDMTGEGRVPCFYDELTASGCDFYKVTPRRVSVKQNKDDIKRLFKDKHFDIFHFNVNTLSYIFPIEEALKSGCKVLIHSRSSNASTTSFITKWLHQVNKIRVHNMDLTRIAVSSMAGEWLFGDSSFEVYHNGVNTEIFRYSEENRSRIRKELGCEEKTVIANVGAFLPVKNHRFMISAFEEFLKIRPASSLWFVGDGPMRKEIEELVVRKELEDKVMFLGIRKDMPELYAAIDLLWFPSLYEGFGNVVLEAESEGVTCLLSERVPRDTIINDNVFSFGLDRTLNEWALKMDECAKAQKSNREFCYKEIEEKGASVKDEIIRLETLYKSMLEE